MTRRLLAASAVTAFAICLLPGSSVSVVRIPSADAFEPVVPWRPSHVAVENVSQKYPVTLMSKLFSSVPKREYAVRNINLSLGQASSSPLSPQPSKADDDDDGVVLLVGRSASGKSTLLRLLAGMEHPAEGRIAMNGDKYDVAAPAETMPGTPPWVTMGAPSPRRLIDGTRRYGVQPVVLMGKPEFDDSLPVEERIVQMTLGVVNQCNGQPPSGGGAVKMKKDVPSLVGELIDDVASLLSLSEEQRASRPSALSPSGEFLFGIACGCAMSVAPALAASDGREDGGDGATHAPILLLDELFDAEFPGTVEKCGEGMRNLICSGGVVVSATHKPEYFAGLATRTVTLSGGRVLTDNTVSW